MRTWTRCQSSRVRCMYCAEDIQRGEPMQEIRFAAVKRSLLRCVKCAEGTPPADLPELPAPPPIVAPSPKPSRHGMTSTKRLAGAFDFKQKQAGDAA